jgi:hypothetical protein
MISTLSICFSLISIITFSLIIYLIYSLISSSFKFYKIYKNPQNIVDKNDKNDKNDNEKEPFVLSFRKTRTEALITSKIDEMSKSRDIQFVVSCYYYNNDKSIKGSIYIITSKILYKLFFVKQTLIVKEIHTFNTFVSHSNKKIYNSIINYLDNNSIKQKHHMEFYTWPHYYFINNYEIQTVNLEKFMKTL